MSVRDAPVPTALQEESFHVGAGEQIHDLKYFLPFTRCFVLLRVWFGLVFETGSPIVQVENGLELPSFCLCTYIL